MRTPAEGRPGGRSCVLSVLNVCWSCAPGAAPGPENRRHTFGIISKPSRIQRPKSGSAKRSAAPRRGLTGQRIPFAMSAERAGDGRRRSQPEGVQRVRGRELALAHRHGLKKVHLPARERGEPVGPRAAQCGAQELFGFEQVVLLDDLGRNGLPLGGKARDEVPRPFLSADGRGRRADDGALKRSVLIEKRLTPEVPEEGPTDGLLSAQGRRHRVQDRTMVVFARAHAAGERLEPVDADHHPDAALQRQSLGKVEDGLPKGGELSSGPREAVGAEQDPEVVRTAVPEPDVGRPGAQPAAQRIGRSASGSTRMTAVAKVLRSVSSSRRAGRSKETTRIEPICRSVCASMSLSVVLPKPSGARTAVGLPAFILPVSFSRSASLRMSSDESYGRDEQCGVTSSMAGSGA